MSNCIKDLHDYDLVKNCSECWIILLKINFHKDKNKNDGLKPNCIFCRKKYYLENRDRKINNQKLYNKQNLAKINTRLKEYFKNRKESDINFKLACNLRSRTSKAFKSQNVRKINKTFDSLGCSHSFFKRWIIHQLYGNMTEENYGLVWEIDHCFPLSKTNLSNQNEMNKSTLWIYLRPIYCSKNIIKGDKIDHRLYLLQQIKAYQFIKINAQEGLD